ncbi:MAG: TAXI family TRAP transporter solute-binding subunit [Magnetococcales bacterium]|nr:TAXI family TRAP transporter solute-binding subunit [Magnetococcales bacterium]
MAAIRLIRWLAVGWLAVAAWAAAGEEAASRPVPPPKPAARQWMVGAGSYYSVSHAAASALCQALNRHGLALGVRCAVEETGGSVHNLNALASGEVDWGLVRADDALTAFWRDDPRFPEKQKNLRTLLMLHTEWATLMVREEADIQDLTQALGQRVDWGGRGSAGERVAQALFRACQTPWKPLTGSLAPSEWLREMKKERLDGVFTVVGHPSEALDALASALPMRLLPLTGPNTDRLLDRHPVFLRGAIPPGYYPGSTEAVSTFGVRVALLTTVQKTSDQIHPLIKTLFEGLEALQNAHPALRELKPETLLQGAPVPLHSGVRRYALEQGWTLPPALPEPENGE